MKKLFFLTFGLLMAIAAGAQSKPQDDLDIIQSIFGKEKKAIVAEFLNLSDQQAASFWPVYDKYESERRELVRTRLNTLFVYVESYPILNNDIANDLAKQVFKNQKNMNCLHQKYFKKMKKSIGAINAFKFIQVEMYIQKAAEMKIMESVPFVGELY